MRTNERSCVCPHVCSFDAHRKQPLSLLVCCSCCRLFCARVSLVCRFFFSTHPFHRMRASDVSDGLFPPFFLPLLMHKLNALTQAALAVCLHELYACVCCVCMRVPASGCQQHKHTSAVAFRCESEKRISLFLFPLLSCVAHKLMPANRAILLSARLMSGS